MNRHTVPFILTLLAALGAGVSCAANEPHAVLAPHDIQGDGDRSPFERRTVTVEGVVTGDFQDYGKSSSGRLGGFYIASLVPDGDPATSDGLFVFERERELGDVREGDVVRVKGQAVEFFEETQLAARQIEVLGRQEVTPVTVKFPLADRERLEGMLLELPETLLIAEHRNLERFGELRLTAGPRAFQFTNRSAPDRRGYEAARLEYDRNALLLDDGFRNENPPGVRYADQTVPPRAGNGITGLRGNLRYSRGSGGDGDADYRLMPVREPRIENLNPRPAAPAPSGNLRIASYNVLNLFSGLDGGEPVCGPSGESGCRGADSAAELKRQLAKTITAFRQMDADIVGIAEIENNARASLELLVDALADDGQRYAYVDAGALGEGSIKNALLYRPDRVQPVGPHAVLDRSVDGRFDSRRSRPAVAQTFRPASGRSTFTVITNHLKSKGSSCDDANDPNRGDGQGNCNRTRNFAAAALGDWALAGATPAAGDDVIIIGDLNAYLREDPIRTLESLGFVNLLDRFVGDTAYSFVWDGRAGALDHALATPALADKVTQVFEWHINADEPRLYDYNLEFDRDLAWFDRNTPWRSSDHDPVIVDIDFSR